MLKMPYKSNLEAIANNQINSVVGQNWHVICPDLTSYIPYIKMPVYINLDICRHVDICIFT